MKKLSHVREKQPIRHQDHNDIVDAINELQELVAALQEAAAGSGGDDRMSGRSLTRSGFVGSRGFEREVAFTCKGVRREGGGWRAYFAPGRVIEVKLGGECAEHPVKLGGVDMAAVPHPSLAATAGSQVWLKVLIDEQGVVSSCEVATGKPGGATPWKNYSQDGAPEEDGTIGLLLGVFEGNPDGSVGYKHYHTGGVIVQRGAIRHRLMEIPEAELAIDTGREERLLTDSDYSVGEGVYKPYERRQDWEEWFNPFMVGHGLKVEKAAGSQLETGGGSWYKLRGTGGNIRLVINGVTAMEGGETCSVILEFKDGFLHKPESGGWSVWASDLLVTEIPIDTPN